MLKHFRLDVLLVYFWRDLPTVPCQNNRMKIPFYFVIFKEVCQGLLKGRSLLHLKSHKAMMTFRVSNPRTLFLWCICFISFYSGSKCVFKLGTEALMGISWQSFIWFNWCKNNRRPKRRCLFTFTRPEVNQTTHALDPKCRAFQILFGWFDHFQT